MGWLYVPGLECSTRAFELVSNSSESTIAPFVMSNGTPTRRPLSWRGWRMRPWIERLFGTILCPSTAAHGVESWIASLRAFPASRTAWQASVKASATSGGYGRTSPESFAMYNHGSFFSKTSGGCFPVAGSKRSSDRWPNCGSMRNGHCYRQAPLALVTSGNGRSFWPTALAHDGRRPGADLHSTQSGNLNREAALWPTPKASEADHPGRMTDSNGQKQLGTLSNNLTALWQSPQTSDANGARLPDGKRSLGLNTAAVAWPTPMARDSDASGSDAAGMMSLTAATRNWPTPISSDHKGGVDARSRKSGMTLGNLVRTEQFLHLGPRTTPGMKSSPIQRTLRPRLNPAFANWLMGWPWWWTNPARISCAAPEMVLYRSRLQQHLSNLFCERV